MDRINHFEIPSNNPGETKSFYGDIFGWEFLDMPEMNYTMVYTVPIDRDNDNMPVEPGAINGGMTVNDPTAKGPVLVITVDSIDDKIAQIESSGGRMVMEKTPVGTMGFYARFEDPSGNIIGIWENQ